MSQLLFLAGVLTGLIAALIATNLADKAGNKDK